MSHGHSHGESARRHRHGIEEAHGAAGHDHEHGHDHDHASAHALGAHAAGASMRRLGASLVVTATVMVAEAVGGWLSGSLALVSDAGHMLTDAGALGLALVAAWLAARPADDKRTFGYRRAEVLGAQLNVGALLVLSIWIAWEAVDRLRTPHEPIKLGLMAIIAAIGLVANVSILWFLHGEHSLNARSAFLHVVADTVSSVAILLGAGAMALRPGLEWLDPVLSVAIAGLILWGALRLILEITDILMESVPKHLDVGCVCKEMECCAGVIAVHDLHIWTISSGLYALSAHLVVHTDAMGRNDDILNAVKLELRRRFGIDHTTLQIESADYAHVHDYQH
ncbi:cation diffusion facilitator family transporter [Anaeromyxobacter oryzae]|uniref:Cadmium, cobalt and zinc/H(+)-K(+) antiporter n=1 Tax=Anaeromyxobacter oryzae TaxID=2918170 RepID=A0ABM7X4B9_9BACT|nr:cation diffusion facilitator family transporter [Anaeromyxobacter oryzae]BDG06609.1 cadmium, cobalt and zinc/H(+)-K(+) antiporter [Anaeromyxobacter oryzae]